jgi:ATP synthase protein I
MPEPKDPLPSLDSLQKKIDDAQTKIGMDQAGKEKQDDTSVRGDMDKAMRVGVELVSGVAVGSIFGYFLDRWLGTMPLFFILCFFLGSAAGFRNLIREARKDVDNGKQ